MQATTIDAVIESLVTAQSVDVTRAGPAMSAREAHVYRESLRGLVRLAQAEQLRDMRTSVKRLTETDPAAHDVPAADAPLWQLKNN